jgi:hypothetical protein
LKSINYLCEHELHDGVYVIFLLFSGNSHGFCFLFFVSLILPESDVASCINIKRY